MNSWLKHLRTAISLNNGLVVITIIATKGSTPCSNGDKIVFTANEVIFGSIGGGNLEFKALSLAKEMLKLKGNSNQLIKYPLGAALGQCCGGYVKVLFESFVTNNSSLEDKDSWIEKVSKYYSDSEDFILATSIDNDKNTVISLREIANENIKVPELIESAIYKLRKHVEQIDDSSSDDEEIGDDFENLYKGEVSKSGVAVLPSKRTRNVTNRIDKLEATKKENQPKKEDQPQNNESSETLKQEKVVDEISENKEN